MAVLYEFDMCTEHARHTLRCEERGATRRQLLSWGADPLLVGQALDVEPGTQTRLELNKGAYSIVTRIVPPAMPSEETLRMMPILGLAGLIQRDWVKPYFGAVPYIDAMRSMVKVTDPYGLDDGPGIVIYFLSNAQTWRGEMARAVKKELKRRLKEVT